MISFLLPFLQRILSGYASYFAYLKNKNSFYLVSLIMIILPIFMILPPYAYSGWAALFFLINIIAIVKKVTSFEPQITGWISKYNDIHFWENIVTGNFMLWLLLSGYNIFMLAFSVYPALIIHKGLINLGNKLPFFSKVTDDPTGKTYNIPLLNIKIKRSSTKLRIILAIISIIGVVLVSIFKWDLYFYLVK